MTLILKIKLHSDFCQIAEWNSHTTRVDKIFQSYIPIP